MDSPNCEINKAFIMGSMLLLLAGALWHAKRKEARKCRKPRRYKVRPLNKHRKTHSQYHFLVQLMKKKDHEQFFKYTRMSLDMYNKLLQLVSPKLQKDPRGGPLTPCHRLTMTLHYLSSGCSMQEIAWAYHVGKSTVHSVVTEVCEVLWDSLLPIVLPPRTKDDWFNIAKEFFKRWNFPNCFGAVDGKHVSIQNPKLSGSEFFSYKKCFRIVKNSWIQCGGYDLEPHEMPCENYVVPHDKRGVLSMCNNGPHKDNSTQFYIALESAPWMNYKYVAFGQLLQGDEVLKLIEDVPTYYQAPTYDITIVKSGEFKTRFHADSSERLLSNYNCEQWNLFEQQMDILTYLKHYHEVIGSEGQTYPPYSWEPPKTKVSCDSVLSETKMKSGTYSLKTDLKTYMPILHLPDFGSDGDEGDEDYNICEPSFTLSRYKNKLYDDNLEPNSSDITI